MNDSKFSRTPAVAFDLDDTLFHEVDFLHSGYRAIAATLNERHPGLDRLVMTDILTGGDRPHAFDRLADYLSEKLPAETAVHYTPLWMRDIYRYHLPEISLSTDALGALEMLSAARIPLGLITDGRSVTQSNKYDALGLSRFIPRSGVFISEEVGCDKHSPDAFRRFMEVVRDEYPSVGSFFYVGDNPSKDIEWPQRLGWSAALLKASGQNIHPQPDTPVPDYRSDSLTDIAEWIIASSRHYRS